MNGKLAATGIALVDPDDAPELTEEGLDELMANGVWRIGARVVSREEGMAAFRQSMADDHPPDTTGKIAATILLDPEVVDAFQAAGQGWQTRINDALQEWLRSHSPA